MKLKKLVRLSLALLIAGTLIQRVNVFARVVTALPPVNLQVIDVKASIKYTNSENEPEFSMPVDSAMGLVGSLDDPLQTVAWSGECRGQNIEEKLNSAFKIMSEWPEGACGTRYPFSGSDTDLKNQLRQILLSLPYSCDSFNIKIFVYEDKFLIGGIEQ
jgi:hypothetical protein